MREDLNKVMCESGRRGGSEFHEHRKDKEKFDDLYEDFDDDQPHKGDSSRGRVGIRSSKIYWNGRKQFDEHLSPLRGIIRKNVGRPWNKVYGELCKVFDKRSVINQHILIHLDQYVETKRIVVRGDKLFYQDTRSYRWNGDAPAEALVPIRESGLDWFVDPRNGILRENKHKSTYRARNRASAKTRREAQLDQKRVFSPELEIERADNGMWYESVYVNQSAQRVEREVEVPDPFTKELVKQIKVTFEYAPVQDHRGFNRREGRVKVKYKALSHAELKHYGVENRVVEDQDGMSNAKHKRLVKRVTRKEFK